MGHLGVGPVFLWEWRRVSRQWWFYAMRSALVGALLAGLAAVWWVLASRPVPDVPRTMAQVGESFFIVIVLGQLATVLLAAPAATAGTFGMERARGHMSLMLITEVTSLDIVLGVLAARLLPVVGGVLCVVPVLAATSHVGGVPPGALVDLVAVTVGAAALGCTLALALSIGARRFHEVLVSTYVLLAVWVLGYPVLMMIRITTIGRLIPGSLLRWSRDVNPFWLAMAPVEQPGSSGSGEAWAFLGATLALSAMLAGLAAWRLRPAALDDQAPAPRRSWGPLLTGDRSGSLLDRHPVFWRECRLRRRSGWIGLLWGLYVTGALLFSVLAVVECAGRGAKLTLRWDAAFNGFQVAVGLLLMSLVTPASLAEERARGSLELLLSTPLSARDVVLGKWLAHYRAVPWIALLPGVVAAAHAVFGGRWSGVLLMVATVLAQGAAVTSLGIALAIWVPRFDRALTISAAVAVFLTIAWIPLMLLLFQDHKALGMGLASASPLFGVTTLTSAIVVDSPESWAVHTGWAMFWILASCAASVALLGAALGSFDACLGRIRPGLARTAPSPDGPGRIGGRSRLLQRTGSSVGGGSCPRSDPIRPDRRQEPPPRTERAAGSQPT
jgi:ABC-type transport system involved in multi-copper enzyme maturation permease subunit